MGTKNKTVEIWGEGFAVTGNSAPACKIEEYEAENFDDAMQQHIKQNPKIQIDIRKDKDGLNIYTNWGCRYYDNEADARKTFG